MDFVFVIVCMGMSKIFLCIMDPRKIFRPDIFFFEGFVE